jgi:sec-independent protein translocase protein TatA
MGLDSPSHWLILGVVVVVLFGYKKLPEMSRSVGRSLRIFKTEMKGMGEDDSARDAAEAPQAQIPAVPPVPPQQAVPAVPVNPLVKPAAVPEGTVPQAAPVAQPTIPAAVQPVDSVPEVPQQQVQS